MRRDQRAYAWGLAEHNPSGAKDQPNAASSVDNLQSMRVLLTTNGLASSNRSSEGSLEMTQSPAVRWLTPDKEIGCRSSSSVRVMWG